MSISSAQHGQVLVESIIVFSFQGHGESGTVWSQIDDNMIEISLPD
jgi:hypothetical protein